MVLTFFLHIMASTLLSSLIIDASFVLCSLQHSASQHPAPSLITLLWSFASNSSFSIIKSTALQIPPCGKQITEQHSITANSTDFRAVVLNGGRGGGDTVLNREYVAMPGDGFSCHNCRVVVMLLAPSG